MRRRREEFFYPEIDLRKDVAIGVLLPFQSETGRLFKLSYTTEQQALSNLKNLILTRKGERYMQPNFGTLIQDLLFDQNTEDVLTKVKESIKVDVEYWLPYITLAKLEVIPHADYENESYGHGVQMNMLIKVSERGANIPVSFTITPNNITVT